MNHMHVITQTYIYLVRSSDPGLYTTYSMADDVDISWSVFGHRSNLY